MFLDKKFISIRAQTEPGQPCSRVAEFLWRHERARTKSSGPRANEDSGSATAAEPKRPA